MKEKYDKSGWKHHHQQWLEFEEDEDESAVTLKIDGPKDPHDKWELAPINSRKVRNFLPRLLAAIEFTVH